MPSSAISQPSSTTFFPFSTPLPVPCQPSGASVRAVCVLCANRRRPQGGTASVAARKKEERAKALLFGAAAAAEIDATAAARVPFSFRSLTHSIIVQSISPHRLRRRSSQPTQKRNPTMAPAKKAVSVFFFLRVFGLRSRRPIAGVMLAAALSARINRFALLLCLPRRQEVSAVAVVECREILSKATVTASLKRATAF